jgi:cytochrome c biogenesis protein CcmG, thiol:disulfide interchange protein DsbE
VNRKVLAVGLGIVLPLLAILVANLGRDPHAVASPLVGRPAPAFNLTPLGGGPAVTLEALRGRPAVINFWATWCGPCLQEHPVLVATARARPDVQFLGVVFDDEPSKVEAFLRRHGTAYPNLVDPGGHAAIAYGLAGVPETFFLDAQGTVVAKTSVPLDPATMADNLAKAQKGAPSGSGR